MNGLKKSLIFVACSLSFVFFLFLVSASVVFADGHIGTGRGVDLPNPLGATETIPQLLDKITDFLVKLAAPIVAIVVVYGAFQILFATGDPEKFATGRKTILYAVVGYAIIWIGRGIAIIIENLLKS